MHNIHKTTNITLYLPIAHNGNRSGGPQQSCVGAKIASEVDAVVAPEVFVPDLADVVQVGSPLDVNLALVNKVLKIILVDLSPGRYGGALAMVKSGQTIYDSGSVVVIFWLFWPAADVCPCAQHDLSNDAS
jgi:hypothetical protein